MVAHVAPYLGASFLFMSYVPTQKEYMIWNDPWIDVATMPPEEGMGVAPFCTTLPPPLPTLPSDLQFQCCLAANMTDSELSEWRTLVGTRWELSALRHRLDGVWIARITVAEKLVSTCVLRKSKDPTWILETLVAKPTGCGYAAALTRSVMSWIYNKRGPFVLGYTWELSLAQLVWAQWRGWLKSAASVEYGWIWKSASCGFCKANAKANAKAYPVGSAQLHNIRGVIVSDSGLGDGLGYVLSVETEVDWAAVARIGGWQALWYHGATAPSAGWTWTGEFVVVGLLNYDGRTPNIPTRWITTEISPSSLREQA
jgi:hypothetical protein